MNEYILVTAPPPTPNGDLHLGHLSGPYLAADVFTRAQKLFGNKVVYLCSTDDHQSWVVTKGLQEGLTAEETATKYSSRIQNTLKAANFNIDCFTSPRNKEHFKIVQEFFLDLFKNGKLKVVDEETCFCESCNRYLFEAYVKGDCPYCDSASGGNYCETCGHPSEPKNLKDPKCVTCNSTPILKNFKRIVLPLEDYREELTAYYNKNSNRWRQPLKKLFSELLSRKLPDVPVTNFEDWGIPVPLDEFKGHIINVWIEMVPGHIQTTKVWAKENGIEQDLWDINSNTQLVQFFGFDNSFYYAVVHTALLLASGNYILADALVTNQFYLQEDQKFSKSRGHAIWGSEFLEDESSDWVRYYLSLSNPENERTGFSLENYEEIISGRICRDWKQFVIQCMHLFNEKDLNNDSLSPVTTNLIKDYSIKFSEIYNLNNFSLREAAKNVHEFVMSSQELVMQIKQRSDAYALLRAFAVFASPIMPNISQMVWKYLGEGESIKWDTLLNPPKKIEAHLEDELLKEFQVKTIIKN